MSSTNRGVAILKFGTYTIATRIVNDSDTSITSEKLIIDDEDGQNVNHIANFGIMGQHTINVIPLATAVTKPVIDSIITYNGQAGALLSFSEVAAKRQPLIWRLVIDFIPGVTYTV